MGGFCCGAMLGSCVVGLLAQWACVIVGARRPSLSMAIAAVFVANVMDVLLAVVIYVLYAGGVTPITDPDDLLILSFILVPLHVIVSAGVFSIMLLEGRFDQALLVVIMDYLLFFVILAVLYMLFPDPQRFFQIQVPAR